jgi:glycosyltransferase involved in cell wall biosynthesis
MRTPLLSIVIPTYRRPQYLSRAIISALGAAPNGDVEVIVVPNGPDDSWKAVAEQLKNEHRVKWRSLEIGHACVARNHGLAVAKGKYIRFLDDDDYLYPAAEEQIQLLDATRAEICSGIVENINGHGVLLGTTKIPDSTDFISALLTTRGFTYTTGNVFLRDSIHDIRWRENVSLYDDFLWMMDLAKSKEWRWVQCQSRVGVYFQHFQERLSFERRSRKNTTEIISSILELFDTLNNSSRSNAEREKALATAILSHAHSNFPANPIYLTKACLQAKKIYRDANPDTPIFQNMPLLRKYHLVIEWILLAPRILSRSYRRASWYIKRNIKH